MGVEAPTEVRHPQLFPSPQRIRGPQDSELHVWHGREKGLDAGTVMGHEFLATVLEVGSEVTGIRRGDRVVSPFTTSCGECFYCTDGLPARCLRG